MGLFTPPEELLMNALISQYPQVHIERCLGTIDAVFRNVLKRERRLLAYLQNYEATYLRKSLVQLCYDYDVLIQYQEPCPKSIDDVIVEDEDWDITALLVNGAPKEATVVTDDTERISKKMDNALYLLLSKYEGIHGWETSTAFFKKLSSDASCRISYSYVLPLQQLRQYQGKARLAAKNIWREILGDANVPQFVKPFLALSYLTQECGYDQNAFDEVEFDATALPKDPVPHLAYGPLVEKRGICSGLAWAFKVLMDEANVECRCISGYLKEDMKTGHLWNLVKIDGQFYHVDPTWGIKDEGVFVSCLMQPDAMMKSTHLWETRQYPSARGMRFDYDYIEEYLFQNGADLVADGANERYLFPDDIVE